MSTTTNLADFGYRELELLKNLIQAMLEQGLPDGFEGSGVHPMMNQNSGNVFLVNEEYQTAMVNGDKLELWNYCPNCGHEGFAGEFQLKLDGCEYCVPDEEEAQE